ncbi:UMP kinase [Candidatus Saccharibacteria bacterium]|nr:UMP kinase [Candidatus Saccharibacteria bacterium]
MVKADKSKYRRILLKLSGEQLAGKQDYGIDHEFVKLLSDEIKKIVDKNVQVVIVVGGGNWLRGASFAEYGIGRSTADYMGMLATLMNALALMDMLEADGCVARVQTNISVPQVAEPFIGRRAIRHLEKGRIVIIAGGTGKPYVTTDSAAVSTALELDCEIVLKGTKVDGVYTKDPMKHKDAKRLDKLTHQAAIENPEVKVMDKAAIGLAMEQKMPIVVFDLYKKNNLSNIVDGAAVGTLVTAQK